MDVCVCVHLWPQAEEVRTKCPDSKFWIIFCQLTFDYGNIL